MRFSTIFTVLAAGAMAFAGAVPEIVAKRSNVNIQNAFNALNSQCDTIIPQLKNCNDNDCTSGVIVQLVAAIDSCKTTLGSCTGGIATTAVASVVADVVTKITVGLNDHKNGCSQCTDLVDIYAQVDVALSACLGVVFKLCLGLSLLVSLLLVSVVVILNGLGLPLVCLLL